MAGGNEGVTIPLMWLPHGRGLALPSLQTPGAAGLDLIAALAEGEPMLLLPGGRKLVPCGFAMALPAGYEAQIRPRSGLAFRHGVTVLNAPGTIDADYRGEVQVLLVNLGEAEFAIRRGDRIAQMVVAPVSRPFLVEAQGLDSTERGAGGFGSTGIGPGSGSPR
jgi:dUTP pyrophosphatase